MTVARAIAIMEERAAELEHQADGQRRSGYGPRADVYLAAANVLRGTVARILREAEGVEA